MIAAGLVEPGLGAQWAAVARAQEARRAAPLSARHGLHAAVQIDRLSDAAFAARAALPLPDLARAADFPAFRATLRAACADLGPIMDLAACGPDGPRLRVVAAPVAPDGFAGLPVADLMVSLYNGGTVPRLMLVQADGAEVPLAGLLDGAVQWWRATLGR